jgi:hypothetical protein
MTDDRPAGLAELPCHSRRYSGNTFIPFPLDPQAYKDKSLAEVVTDLLKRLPEFTKTRRDYYDSRRSVNSKWVFCSRNFLAVAGALAFSLTAVAAVLQVAPEFAPWSRVALILVLRTTLCDGRVARNRARWASVAVRASCDMVGDEGTSLTHGLRSAGSRIDCGL